MSGGGEGGGTELTFLETPTWILALVFALFIGFSLLFEEVLHNFVVE